jgi:ABC-2 type transport system ATP-binding protein
MVEKQVMIEGRNLAKVFNDFWGRPKVKALRNVDIKVESGTIFGLLGPNGAGKSTLIKLILGHLYPSNGVISVLGKNPRDVATKQRIGYLPERTSFYANLTAEETLTFFGRLLGIPDGETSRRSKQLFRMVGLEHAAKRLVGEFSHGMRKRLGLAQALLNDPDLLLLDEPTAGLDPIGCREVKDLILTLGKRGKTILLTSHLLGDVQDVSDMIMVIYGGQVQAVGEISELLAKKDEIEIKSKLVSPEALRKVKGILENDIPNNEARISYPEKSLEEYFLSVVAEANRSKKTTSGAEMGEGIADYLKSGITDEEPEAPKPEDIPEPIVGEKVEPEPVAIVEEIPPEVIKEPEPEPEPEKPLEVIEEKTPVIDEPVEKEIPVKPEPAEEEEPEAEDEFEEDDIDWNVLDSLTKK